MCMVSSLRICPKQIWQNIFQQSIFWQKVGFGWMISLYLLQPLCPRQYLLSMEFWLVEKLNILPLRFWDLFKNNVLSVIIVAGGFILPFTLWLWASSYFHYPSYWGYCWSSCWLLGCGKEEIISHSWFLAFIFILSFL